MADRVPAQVFPPGEFIRDEMEARGWTQAVLAKVMGRPVQAVNELILAKKAVTPETARELAEAFGTSATFWLNLENAYRLWLLAKKDTESGKGLGEVARRARLYDLAPVNDMIKRGWIAKPETADDLEGSLKGFFGAASLDTRPALSMAARKSDSYAAKSPAQVAWGYRVLKLARSVGAAKFTRASFEKGLVEFRSLITHAADVRRVPTVLAELGVRLVVVERLPGSLLDGACLRLDPGKAGERPVVALTGRYDRIDNFWFTLCHELAHVLLGHEESFDENLVGEGSVPSKEKPEAERLADQWAANYLLPNDEIERFILRVKPYYSKVKIIQFANRIRVHPGIILGQLQRRDEVGYGHSREMLVKVRAELTKAAMTDGWDEIPPPVATA